MHTGSVVWLQEGRRKRLMQALETDPGLIVQGVEGDMHSGKAWTEEHS